MANFFAECRVKWNGPDVSREAARATGLGLDAGAVFLTARFKEVLSSPAPRVRVKSSSGLSYYRALTPAIPGAPPRKLSGRLRAGQMWETVSALARRVGTNVKYARRHEKGAHPYLMRTVKAVARSLASIIGNTGASNFRGN